MLCNAQGVLAYTKRPQFADDLRRKVKKGAVCNFSNTYAILANMAAQSALRPHAA